MSFFPCCINSTTEKTVDEQQPASALNNPTPVKEEQEEATAAEPVKDEEEEPAKPAEEPAQETDERIIEDGEEFEVEIDRTSEMKTIGANIYPAPPELAGVIPMIKPGSLVEKTVIKRGDRIMAVNGKSGAVDFSKVMLEIQTQQVLKLKLKRPKKYPLSVEKKSGLGLTLKYGKDEDFLLIDHILEKGSVAAINKKYSDRAVRILDCIVKVNQVENSASQMLQEIADADFLELTLFRWYSKVALDKLLKQREDQKKADVAKRAK